jgi:hypothetical protein
LKISPEGGTSGRSRPDAFIPLLICGLATAGTVVIGDPFLQLGVQVFLVVVFLATFLFVKRRKKLESFREVFFAFFVFALAAVAGGVSSGIVFLSGSANGPLSFVANALAVVLVIMMLTKASGRSVSSLYLARGNLRLGLIVGVAMFAAFTLSIVPGFELIFGASTGVNFGRVLSVLPLAMVASFLNAPKRGALV